MFSYNQVCQELKKGVTTNYVPSYKIELENSCNDEDLLLKTEKMYEKWINHDATNRVFNSRTIGCCEVGQFTGNELLRVLVDICSNMEYNRPGSRLFLDIEGQSKAVLLFVKDNFLTKAAAPCKSEGEVDEIHRGMFAKLFNDRKVQSFQGTGFQDFYTPLRIKQYRSEAKGEFPLFLATKLAEFPFYPYGKCFLGLIAKCAFRMSSCDSLKGISRVKDDVELIPFPACIQFAFQTEVTGILTHLLGELPRATRDDNASNVDIGNFILNTSKQLILRAVPRASKNPKFFDRKETKKIKTEIKKLFDVNADEAN